MRTIHKFKLGGATILDIGTHAEILHVAEQHGHLMMWVAYDLNKTLTPRKFAVYPTGTESLPDGGIQFISTVLMSDGLVWHVFEIIH